MNKKEFISGAIILLIALLIGGYILYFLTLLKFKGIL